MMLGKAQRNLDIVDPIDIRATIYPDIRIANAIIAIGADLQLARKQRILGIPRHETQLDEITRRGAYRVSYVKPVKYGGTFGQWAEEGPVQDEDIIRVDVDVTMQEFNVGLDVFIIDIALVQLRFFGSDIDAFA